MNFTVLTIFPEIFKTFWEHGIIKRAVHGKKIFTSVINIRDYAKGTHRVVDDKPYGGGCGMVLKPEPLAGAIRAAKEEFSNSITIHLTPQGRLFNQDIAKELANCNGLILVCGRYEGIDERICHDLIDYEVSLGNFVLTGGELAAMVVIDAITRLIPGVLGCAESAQKDSLSNNLLKHDQYTRPQVFEDNEVPEVLLSGNHKNIDKWRLESSMIRTFLKRQELLTERTLETQEIEILKKWARDICNIIETQEAWS